ncbi:MAG TPA: hypothetical protein VH877_33195 [Polyangia bacterium]|jgi:hypothetical protein|nr:hypothetical protein [Polyangia bacterium]
MPVSPNWKLRRLAPRAKRVQARRARDAQTIAAYAGTLPGKADAFIRAYDAIVKYESTWRRVLREGHRALARLEEVLHVWLPRLGRDVPGLDVASFTGGPDAPDSLLGHADRLLTLIEDHRDRRGAPLPYKDGALIEIQSALALAHRRWTEAEAIDARYQHLLRDMRLSYTAFDAELKAFRRSLCSAFGRSDKDFQKLRIEHATEFDEDDDVDAPLPPPALLQGGAPRAEPR